MKIYFRCLMLLVLMCAFLLSTPNSSKAVDSYEKIMGQLEMITLPRLRLSDDSLDDVLGMLRDMTELDFVMTELLTSEDVTVKLTLAPGTSVLNFLKIITEFSNVKFYYDDGIIIATTKDHQLQSPILRIYSVGGLKIKIPDFPGPEIILTGGDGGFEMGDEDMGDEDEPLEAEQIIELIQEFIEPDSWDNEGVSIKERGTNILVQQTPEIHQQIASLLAMLGD